MPSPMGQRGGGQPGYRPFYGSDARKPQKPPRNYKRGGLFAIAAVAAVIFSAVWNPPTGSVHDFTEASDYKIERESGCTNSGKGCHGSETEYTDFNAYHPNAECTTCHDYQGVGCIPCHKPREHECQVCHDGTLEAAPNRMRLTQSYPRGHYRETTHTATGTDMQAEMRATVSGSDGEVQGNAKATCNDCHSRDLKGAHTGVPVAKGSQYGQDVGCGECHNDVRAFGLAEVLSDWKNRGCEDCHKVNSSAPMHDPEVAQSVEATGTLSCGDTGTGCHAENDLHALHADAPENCSGKAGKGEPTCHNFEIEAHQPTARGCGADSEGACHERYVNDAYSHDNDREVHSPDTRVPASNTTFEGIECGACHFMEPDGVSLVTEHERASSAHSNSPNSCRNCHDDPASAMVIADDWSARDTAESCDGCHGTDGLDAAHTGDLDKLHVAEGSKGCADTGAGCHPGTDLFAVGDPVDGGLHSTCLRCHAKTASEGNAAFDPANKSCGQGSACHGKTGEYDPRTGVHAGSSRRTDGADDAHRATGIAELKLADAATGLETPCTACHADALGTEHGRPSNTIAAGSSTFKTVTVCEGCHSATGITADAVKTDWAQKSGAEACTTCHGTPGVPPAHSLQDLTHRGVELADNGVATPGTCLGAGCHDELDVRKLHRGPGCTTKGCHANTGNINGLDTLSCGGNDPDKSCHVGYSALEGHAANAAAHNSTELDTDGDPTPGFCASSGCHTSANLKAVHGANGCAIEGCHKPGTAPTITSCGGDDPAESCHNGFSASQHFVDHATGLRGTVNGVTYGPGENEGCLGCHPGDLRNVHTATTDGPITGGGATSCRVCHDDPADDGNGDYAGLADVKAAIANRDHRCVACHDSGTASPSSTSASSAHKRVSTETRLPAGYVWSDPLEQWKTALNAPMGGGHNVAWNALSGFTKRFPVTEYRSEGTTYTWNLPPNSGTTKWLDGTALGVDVDTVDEMRAVTMGCDDCHEGTSAMAGPHGSAVKITIDAEYSQTEYANPTRGRQSQFETTGTERVVCFKCHTIGMGSVEGTTSPGGSYVHRAHAKHTGAPTWHPLHYGEKCVDCHVRIPHAWRSPRLLARTVTSDGRPADTYPYVSKDHDGLAGIVLRDYTTPTDLRSRYCANGGCHGFHGVNSHPLPSDIPTATYWP